MKEQNCLLTNSGTNAETLRRLTLPGTPYASNLVCRMRQLVALGQGTKIFIRPLCTNSVVLKAPPHSTALKRRSVPGWANYSGRGPGRPSSRGAQAIVLIPRSRHKSATQLAWKRDMRTKYNFIQFERTSIW